MRTHLVKTIMLASTLTIGLAAHAATSTGAGIPYFGERAKPCSINTPKGDSVKNLDAGAIADEECNTIYVMPPDTGSIRLSPPGYKDLSLCPLFHRMDKAAKALEDKILADPAEQIKDSQAFEALRKRLQAMGGDEAFSQFSFSVSLDWNTLLKAYQDANPGKSVERMKIVAGMLNGRVVSLDSDVGESDQVASLRLFGIKPKPDDSATGFNSAVGDDLFKKLTKYYDVTNQFLFGTSIAGQMGVKLPATCAIFSPSSGDSASAKSLFSATYTYFYPIQTMSSYTLTIQNQTEFEHALLEKAQAKDGTVTRAQVEEILGKVSPIAFRKDGVENDGKVDDDYAKKMTAILSDAVINSVAQKITMSVNSGRATRQESRYAHRCHGDWPFTHCGNEEYKVTVNYIDWRKVEARLHELLQDQKDSVTAKTYRVMYLYGTSSFLNLENNKE